MMIVFRTSPKFKAKVVLIDDEQKKLERTHKYRVIKCYFDELDGNRKDC